jgi:hypothetical protein
MNFAWVLFQARIDLEQILLPRSGRTLEIRQIIEEFKRSNPSLPGSLFMFTRNSTPISKGLIFLPSPWFEGISSVHAALLR